MRINIEQDINLSELIFYHVEYTIYESGYSAVRYVDMEFLIDNRRNTIKYKLDYRSLDIIIQYDNRDM